MHGTVVLDTRSQTADVDQLDGNSGRWQGKPRAQRGQFYGMYSAFEWQSGTLSGQIRFHHSHDQFPSSGSLRGLN